MRNASEILLRAVARSGNTWGAKFMEAAMTEPNIISDYCDHCGRDDTEIADLRRRLEEAQSLGRTFREEFGKAKSRAEAAEARLARALPFLTQGRNVSSEDYEKFGRATGWDVFDPDGRVRLILEIRALLARDGGGA